MVGVKDVKDIRVLKTERAKRALEEILAIIAENRLSYAETKGAAWEAFLIAGRMPLKSNRF